MGLLDIFRKKPSPAQPSLAATAKVITPEIPLKPNNPAFARIERASSKDDLAILDAQLALEGYSAEGQVRKALRLKYEATI